MKRAFLSLTASFFAGVFGVTPVEAAVVTGQDPGNVVGSGATAWSYLVLEGEDYNSKSNPTNTFGFARVDASGTVKSFLNNPVLGADTTASKKGALWCQTDWAPHEDKATYQVQFAKAGTYYLYMRFTMFEGGEGLTSYTDEDSIFVPPDFGKDPQTDWSDSAPDFTGGLASAGGYHSIAEKGGGGVRVAHGSGDEARDFWEGKFHWNDLADRDPDAEGKPRKFVVTASQVGKPLPWTISYREGFTAVDLFLFSTNPNLIDQYSQEELDGLFIKTPVPQLASNRAGSKVQVSWPSSATGFVLESSTALSPAAWTGVTTPPVVVVGDQNTVTLDAATGGKFYRLKKP